MATVFTRAVKNALKREHLTYKDLAAHLGVSNPYLSDVMNDNRSLTEERAQVVCDLLKIDMDLYYISKNQIPTDIVDALGHDGLVAAIADLRKNYVE